MNKVDTKEKILVAAEKLFSENGYEGTSLREIANLASVNLSGIAYHFDNKENLYWSTFMRSNDWLESEIKNYVQSGKCVEDVFIQIFDFLTDNSKQLRNAFMTMLSDSFPMPAPCIIEKMCAEKEMGPPGAKYLMEVIRKEVGSEASEEDVFWAMEVLFAHTIHWALLMSGKTCKVIYEDNIVFTEASRHASIKRHCRSVVKSLI
ncbi:MAG: hypothetical protein CL677_06950 [Bdellovibrionaceae bacterium]|nr:hypothetical protein [Pseudobdellovibrionaceae bacterium]|tara:strand:- start:285 stop:899 length:615 start_codon:yes stop_codon:yes gene_type:complete